MGLFDSGFGDWFSGDYGFGDSGGGSGFDWGSVDLGSIFGGGGGSSGSSWGSMLGSLFGGGGSSSGGSGDIFGALLSGLAGGAAASLDAKSLKEIQNLRGQQALEQLKEQGLQGRKSLDYEYQLKDYYGQQDKGRKRVALDTYGQFSQLDRIKKNYTQAPGVQIPNKPTPAY
jgi:hypothetical protein